MGLTRYQTTNPRYAVSVPSVTIRGLTPAQAMITPLSAPPSRPIATGSRNASATLTAEGSFWAKTPENMPATASSDPTERSIPAVRMVKVIPMAIIPITDTCSNTSRALSGVRNCGSAMAKYATSAPRAR